MRLLKVNLVLIIAVIIAGCGPTYTAHQKSVMAFHEGRYTQSSAELKEVVNTKHTMNNASYPLMQLTLADAEFRLGNYQSALEIYTAAAQNMQAEVSGLKAAGQFFKKESSMLYRGEPHDHAFVHYYMGLCYFMMDNYDAARIEFAQARLEDKGKETGQEDDILMVHFMEGLCYKHLGDLDEAAVSFRKITEMNPDFPYGWYELAIVSDQMSETYDADEYYAKYTSLVPEDAQLPRDDDAECAFLIIDVGDGPYRKPDVIIGEFSKYTMINFAEKNVKVKFGDNQLFDTYKADDIYMQAKTEGGFAGDAAKKVASVAAKKTLEMGLSVFGLGGLAPKSEADCRVWCTLPCEIHMALLPLDQFDTNMALEFYDKNNNRLESHEQNWYYISPVKHSEMKPIILLSQYRLHDLNVDHLTVQKKYKAQTGFTGAIPMQ